MKFATETKVGIFVFCTLLLVVYLSVRINRSGFTLRPQKTLYIYFEDVSGLVPKTPVEYLGIRVGMADTLSLEGQRPRVKVFMKPEVPVYEDTRVYLTHRGLLGEKVIAISGGGKAPLVPDGGSIQASASAGGLEDAMKNISDVSAAIKDLIRGGEGRPSVSDIVDNMTVITEDLREILKESDFKGAASNFKLTMSSLRETADGLNRIMAKVEKGEGTVGKLLTDESTASKVTETIEDINDFVGRLQRLEVAVGFRGEYLSTSAEMQSVASFKFTPGFGKYFLLEFTSGPLDITDRRTTITNTTTHPPGTVIETTEVKRSDSFSVTALFAKRFYDVTLKAGLMRSSGGVGFEYYLFRDHLALGMEAFDFGRSENPHLRLFAQANLFKILYLNGGVDDLIQENKRRNYFGGLGIMLTDNDLKSLLGLATIAR